MKKSFDGSTDSYHANITQCGLCGSILKEHDLPMRICPTCASLEYKGIKKYFASSFIEGFIFSFITLLILLFFKIHNNQISSDDIETVMCNNFIYQLGLTSSKSLTIIGLVTFLIPFGKSVNMGRNYSRVREVGCSMTLAKWFLSFITAPVVIVMRLIRLIRLKKLLAVYFEIEYTKNQKIP